MDDVREQRLRLYLFGALAALLAGALLGIGYMRMREKLRVPAWTEYLGENERAALAQAVDPAPPGPTSDPNLNVATVRFEPMQNVRHAKGEIATFEVVGDRDKPIEVSIKRIIDHWKRRGLEFRMLHGDVLSARQPESDAYYSLRLVHDEGPQGARRAIVWRILPAHVAARVHADTSAAPAWQRDLLPPLTKSDSNMELGEPGKPGYTQMFDVYCGPGKAFRVVSDELHKRGWEEFEAMGKLGNTSGVDIQGARTVVMRHPDAPLGCQLMVSAHPQTQGASQAFIALF